MTPLPYEASQVLVLLLQTGANLMDDQLLTHRVGSTTSVLLLSHLSSSPGLQTKGAMLNVKFEGQ